MGDLCILQKKLMCVEHRRVCVPDSSADYTGLVLTSIEVIVVIFTFVVIGVVVFEFDTFPGDGESLG